MVFVQIGLSSLQKVSADAVLTYANTIIQQNGKRF